MIRMPAAAPALPGGGAFAGDPIEAHYPKTMSFRAALMPFMRIACPIPRLGYRHRKRHPHNDMGWKEVSGVFVVLTSLIKTLFPVE